MQGFVRKFVPKAVEFGDTNGFVVPFLRLNLATKTKTSFRL